MNAPYREREREALCSMPKCLDTSVSIAQHKLLFILDIDMACKAFYFYHAKGERLFLTVICSRFLSLQLVYLHRHSFTSHMFLVYLHALFVSEMHVVYSQALISFCSDTERFEFPHTHTHTQSIRRN